MTEKEIQELFVTHSFQDAKRTLIDECRAMGHELMGHENVFELKALALRGSRSSDGVGESSQSSVAGGSRGGGAISDPETDGAGEAVTNAVEGDPSRNGDGVDTQNLDDQNAIGGGEPKTEQPRLIDAYLEIAKKSRGTRKRSKANCRAKSGQSADADGDTKSERNGEPNGDAGGSGDQNGGATAEQLDDEAKRKMAEAQDLMKQAQEMREAKRKREEEERKKREEEQNKKNRHYRTDEVVRRLKCLHKAFLVGPAGTGKSTLAMCACKELFGIDGGMEDVAKSKYFAQISFSPDTVSADMLGFTDVNGVFHETDIIRVFREGGLILFDEMDDADASLLVKLNTMLANRVIPTPSGMVVQNKDTYIVGTANTYGTGGTSMYVGRNRLDAATLDRWKMATIHVDYDVELEDRIIGGSLDERGKTELCTARNAIRDCISANKWRQICSTRFVIDCCSMMKSGYKLNQCIDTYLLSWDENNRNAVNKRIRDDLKALSK